VPEEQLNDKIAEYAEYIKLIILALLLAAVVYYIVKRLTKNKKHDSL
jgi:large-conductance mechanosensitive channel